MNSASFVDIKTDVQEVKEFLKDLNINGKALQKRVLRGLGNEVKNVIKKDFSNHLKSRTGSLKKSLVVKVARSGGRAVVSNDATRDKIRYGFALAKGYVIKPKNGNFLTFQINGKWVRKHEIVVPEHDWVEGPGMRFIKSEAYRKKIDKLVDREIILAERRAAKAQAKANP